MSPFEIFDRKYTRSGGDPNVLVDKFGHFNFNKPCMAWLLDKWNRAGVHRSILLLHDSEQSKIAFMVAPETEHERGYCITCNKMGNQGALSAVKFWNAIGKPIGKFPVVLGDEMMEVSLRK